MKKQTFPKGTLRINSKITSIILSLHKKGGAMTANEISKDTKIAYLTVQKYLRKLEEWRIILIIKDKGKRKIHGGKRSETKRYNLNYDLILHVQKGK